MQKITAAITTFNRLEALKNAIKSVENQTFLPIELIIIDDNSNDETQKFCENLTAKFPVIYLRNDKNMGACFCRNLAIKHASGDYIAFLDDDDEWERDKLLKQNEFAEKNFDLIYTAVSVGKKKVFHENRPLPPKIAVMLIGNFVGITSAMMFKLSFLQKIGNFDINLPALQDYELVIRAVNNGAKIQGINIPLVKYQPSDCGNISGNPKKFFMAAKIIMAKTHLFYKPLQFIGLSRNFLQKITKSKEFRKKLFKRI